MTIQRKAGLLLAAAAILSAIGYAILGPAFDWPAILDEPGTVALPAFIAHETAVRAGFLVMLASSTLLVAAAVYAHQAWARTTAGDITVSVFGVLGATIQTFGWARWPVAMPALADSYAAVPEAQRAALASDYDLLNSYAGGTLGEHLGWMFQAVWAVGLAWWLWQRSGMPQWLTGAGLGISVLWAITLPVGTGFGLPALEFVGVNSYSLWFVWLLALGSWASLKKVRPPAVASVMDRPTTVDA